MKRKIIPGVIDGERRSVASRPVHRLRGGDADARARVGAVMVVEGGRLKWIVTERDLVFCLLADGRDPRSTKLAEI